MALAAGDCRHKNWKTPAASAVPLTEASRCYSTQHCSPITNWPETLPQLLRFLGTGEPWLTHSHSSSNILNMICRLGATEGVDLVCVQAPEEAMLPLGFRNKDRRCMSENLLTFRWQVSMRPLALWRLVIWPALILLIPLQAVGETSDKPSAAERLSVGELFEPQVLSENVLATCGQASLMPADVRYEFLRSRIMPAGTNQLRFYGKLAPISALINNGPLLAGPDYTPSGGKLISPVIDLISTAKDLGRLEELQQLVNSLQPVGEVQQRSRLSFLALIAMAKSDEEAAGLVADQLFARLLTGSFPTLYDRMPETLFVWDAAERGILTADAERFLVHIWDHQVQPSKMCGPGEWDRLIINLIGRVRYLKLDAKSRSQAYHDAPKLSEWRPVTKNYAWVVGTGVPAGHAQLIDRTVVQLSRADDESLLFATPLRGNFTVECECSGFGYKDCHPFVAGKWIAPVYTHDTVWIGDVTKSLPNIVLDPKLSLADEWIRYRIEMRDGVCSRFINGRLIHEETLGRNHDPWVAIRTPSYGEGSVRDVRITGQPIVPEEISLTAQGVESWISWHDDPLFPEKFAWRAETNQPGEIHLVSPRKLEFFGTAAERLLRYHWPLVWDSEVTYNFYFSKDQSLVHPSIGQLAFLLTDSGVKTHAITNGVWDSTGLDPSNQNEPALELQGRPLPLQHNSWNTMKLRLNDEFVTLELNGTIIIRHRLDQNADRTFGLFHYCDQSEARVRNVVLKGAWPKTVSPLNEQELRGIQCDELDRRRDELSDNFEMDFAKATQKEFLSSFLFTYSNQGTESAFEKKEDGLHASAKAPAGTMAIAFVAPRITIQGDFDITADYENLMMEVPDEGACGIYEYMVFPNLGNRTSSVIRSVGQFSNAPLRHASQVELIDPNRGGATYPRILSDESLSGRLRTSRRGKMLTFLIAAQGTENFRVLHSEEFSDEPIPPNSLQLRSVAMSFGKKNASMNLVWQKLSVKAEKIFRD